MKYISLHHGQIWKIYETLEDLLNDEHVFKNLYQMDAFGFSRYDDLSEEEEMIIDARSWEIRGWGYHPQPLHVVSESEEK